MTTSTKLFFRRLRHRLPVALLWLALAFGVGTNLTNDLGYVPLQIVIKMIRCNGQPVAKLSDTPSKNMCDDENYLRYLRQVATVEFAPKVKRGEAKSAPGPCLGEAAYPAMRVLPDEFASRRLCRKPVLLQPGGGRSTINS